MHLSLADQKNLISLPKISRNMFCDPLSPCLDVLGWERWQWTGDLLFGSSIFKTLFIACSLTFQRRNRTRACSKNVLCRAVLDDVQNTLTSITVHYKYTSHSYRSREQFRLKVYCTYLLVIIGSIAG